MQTSTEHFSVGEAADYLGVSIESVRRWTQSKDLPHWRTPGNQRRYNRSDLDAFVIARRERGLESLPTDKLAALKQQQLEQLEQQRHQNDLLWAIDKRDA